MTQPKNELFFVVSRPEESGPVAFVRVKTPMGSPHIAFTDQNLGRAYLKAKKASELVTLLAASEVTADMKFDFSSGLLILDSLEEISDFLKDPKRFDYKSRITSYEALKNLPDPDTKK